jgi:sugar phosphate isomerase/epimerase
MRIGRDYTNCFVFEHLDEGEKEAFKRGELDLSSINAIALEKAKRNVELQFEVTKQLGLEHVELDGDSPNPYLEMTPGERKGIQELAESYEVSLSLHLPYSYVGSSVCAPQETVRRAAVELQKRCMRFAADIGASYVNIHPGSAPFYQRTGKYRELIYDALLQSLLELDELARELGLILHLENNTAFDEIYSEVPECIEIVEELRERGASIYFNLDIGHWFTRADVGKEIPEPPESVMEAVPAGFVKELHLNDYVPEKRMFHPPLHLELGLLKRGNLERYARLVRQKGAELIVLETALKTPEQVLTARKLLEDETEFVRSTFSNA